MELVNMIRIIRPIEDAAQKEYIREFFRFIGCVVADLVVDTKVPEDWKRCLRADNEEDGVDIVVNYYGMDASRMECAARGIKRVYLYWSLGQEMVELTRIPRETKPLLKEGVDHIYVPQMVLDKLINILWEDTEDLKYLKNLRKLYCGDKMETRSDLFYLLQAKRCLRALSAGSILENIEPEKIEVTSGDYLSGLLNRLSYIYRELSKNEDPHSIYARINAAYLFWEVVRLLPVSNYELVKSIVEGNGEVAIPPVRELLIQAQKLLGKEPQFLSALLMMANLYRSDSEADRKEEECYLQVLKAISREKKEYGFIWYRAGTFYEKFCGNISKAVRCYQWAVRSNPRCFQALFRLGYHSVLEGRFQEAENMLYLTVDAILNGRDPERNQNKEYPNWQFLSLKEAWYIYMVYMLLAKIAINDGREYSARAAVGKACLAATKFEEALLVRNLAEGETQQDTGYKDFMRYHAISQPVWTLWHILEPWSQYIVQDDYVQHVVHVHLKDIYAKRG